MYDYIHLTQKEVERNGIIQNNTIFMYDAQKLIRRYKIIRLELATGDYIVEKI